MTSGAELFLKHSLCITRPPSQKHFARWQHRAAPARPGRRCLHFMLKWRYAEVLKHVNFAKAFALNFQKNRPDHSFERPLHNIAPTP